MVIVSSGLPDPHGKGYQVLLYHRIFALSEHFEIIVCVPKFLKVNDNQRRETKFYNARIFKVTFFDLIRNMLSCCMKAVPLQTLFCTSRSLKKHISEQNYEVKLCILSRNFCNFENPEKNKIIIDFVDSMYLNFQRRADNSKYLKYLYKLEAKLCKNFDSDISRKTLSATSVSKIDADLIGGSVHVHPIGVPITHRLEKREYQICFTGNMNYPPNVQAIEWFYENVWRRHYSSLAYLKLKIIGRNPSSKLIKLMKNDPTVHLMGFVEDIECEIAKSMIAIAPMQSGSGMQFKILEAMAVGTPVIATDLAVGDIRAKSGKHLVICNEPDYFATNILELVSDFNKWQKISQCAKEFVRQNHDWNKLNIDFVNEINKKLIID